MKLNKLFAITAMALAVFAACDKDDDKEPTVAPKLTYPENGAVINPSSLDKEFISFQWDQAQNRMKYKLLFSTDRESWEEVGHVIAESSKDIMLNEYTFEINLNYYWKVKAVGLDDSGQETEETVDSKVYSFKLELVPISNLSYKSSSYIYWPDDYQGSTAFVDLTWEDSSNMEYVEITFEPALEGVEQPIKVEAGKQSCRIEGFEGLGSVAGSPEAQVFEFTVKTHGVDYLVTEGESFKAQPLTHTFIHDVDYNTYIPVQMGDQVWLSTNLKTTHFNDGSDLVYSYYYNGVTKTKNLLINGWTDGEHAFDEKGYSIYASEYTVLLKQKSICPDGFHIPTMKEYEELQRFIGVPEDEIGTRRKYIGVDRQVANVLKATEGWGYKADGTSANGSDPYHFNLKPNQYLKVSGEYTSSGEEEYCPVATILIGLPETGVSGVIVSSESDGIYTVSPDLCSIRCIQDSE